MAAAAADSAATPPLPLPLLAVRSKDFGIQVRSGLPGADKVLEQLQDNEGECRSMAFSSDGRMIAWCNAKSVKIVTVPEGKVLCTLPRSRVSAMEFSPAGNYLCTWELYAVREGQATNDNVGVWNAQTGELVRSYVQRKNENWQPQWTSDDGHMALLMGGGVMVFKREDLSNCMLHAKIEDLAAFKLAPHKSTITFAAFIAGKSGRPSSARLYTAPNYSTPICNKSFFNADKVEMTWNKQGTAVLVNTSSDVDKSGQSYYGETHMYYMQTKDGQALPILLDKNGPIYDCCWAPNGKEFAICYGFMPAKVSLFNHNCDIIREYGTGPRNVVAFNPSGTILAIAGFGNLRGEIEFWDRKNHTLVNKLRAPDSTYFAWCPDSRHIVTATTSPRLKVDNGIKIWHYTQGLVWQKAVQELWATAWQPVPDGSYPTRPVSPVPVQPVSEEAKAAAAKPTVYRPPGARGKPASFSLRDETKPAAALASAAVPVEAAKSKSQKKKEKAKAKAEAAAQAEAEAAKAASATAPVTTATAAAAPETTADVEKKLRNLRKKMRAIEELKTKCANGATLEPEQMEKMNSEATLAAEIADLEKSLAALSA